MGMGGAGPDILAGLDCGGLEGNGAECRGTDKAEKFPFICLKSGFSKVGREKLPLNSAFKPEWTGKWEISWSFSCSADKSAL
ncbi:hypothetical protein PDUR_26040 [Paenibacillus durus]|uniref:Uncharacterized protein n=1 Tax=Paenibacillus durus TaxID=44251 RepID=A0A089HX83_PAEDU|nr:hypothetical protein PDUR_26040 [Paenibacillus durus]